MDVIKELSKYGIVKTCKVINENIVTIVITDGFSQNSEKTFEFIKRSVKPIHRFCVDGM